MRGLQVAACGWQVTHMDSETRAERQGAMGQDYAPKGFIRKPAWGCAHNPSWVTSGPNFDTKDGRFSAANQAAELLLRDRRQTCVCGMWRWLGLGAALGVRD